MSQKLPTFPTVQRPWLITNLTLHFSDLSHNNIFQVTSGVISSYSVLFELKLAGNNINHLPKDFLISLNKLQKLDLANNQLETLPSVLFQSCKNLQFLDLAHNKLTHLPPELFQQVQSLQVLLAFTGYEKIFNCDTKDPENQTAATILISLGSLGVGANLALMAVILLRRPLRRSENQ